MSITRDRLAVLTQCIRNLQIFKIDSKNKFQSEQDSSFESCSKTTKQRDRRNDTTQSRINQIDNSINENWSEKIAKLSLKEVDEQSSDFKNERICYNCDEKEHITSKCSKLKQKNSQINVIRNFRQRFQIDDEKASSIHFITEFFDESKH